MVISNTKYEIVDPSALISLALSQDMMMSIFPSDALKYSEGGPLASYFIERYVETSLSGPLVLLPKLLTLYNQNFITQ